VRRVLVVYQGIRGAVKEHCRCNAWEQERTGYESKSLPEPVREKILLHPFLRRQGEGEQFS